MKNSMKKWTEDDEIYLEYYLYDDKEKEKSYDAAAEFLGRSVRAVKKKVWRMRKLDKNIGHINKPYSEKEIAFIKEYYPTMTAKNIGERLNRSRKSVTQKAWELGLKKSLSMKDYRSRIRDLVEKGYTDYEIEKKLKIHRQSVSNFRKMNNL